MRSKAEPGWWLWVNVPTDFDGVWKVNAENGWTYYGGFSHGTLIAAVTLQPGTDADTKAGWCAMMELSVGCFEPRVRPMLPPARVLPFPVSQSLGA